MDTDLLKKAFALGMRTAGARLHKCCTVITESDIQEELPVFYNFLGKQVIELSMANFFQGRISAERLQLELEDAHKFLDDNQYFGSLVKPLNGA